MTSWQHASLTREEKAMYLVLLRIIDVEYYSRRRRLDMGSSIESGSARGAVLIMIAAVVRSSW